MHLHWDWVYLPALLGMGFTFASFVMKRMLWLRLLAVAANVCFVVYGFVGWIMPSLVLNAVLLPVNLKRAWDIRRLTADIKRATELSPVSQWLLPHMTRGAFKAGRSEEH